MLRGDDVAELQRRLNALGFDAGREDGILGAETEPALARVPAQRRPRRRRRLRARRRVAALRRVGALADGLGRRGPRARRRCAATRRRLDGPPGASSRPTPGLDRARRPTLRRGLERVGRVGRARRLGRRRPRARRVRANRFGADLFLALRGRRRSPAAGAPTSRRRALPLRAAAIAPRRALAERSRPCAPSSSQPRRPRLRRPARDPHGRGASASSSRGDDADASRRVRRRASSADRRAAPSSPACGTACRATARRRPPDELLTAVRSMRSRRFGRSAAVGQPRSITR